MRSVHVRVSSRISSLAAVLWLIAACATTTSPDTPQDTADVAPPASAAPIVCDDALGPDDPLRPIRGMVEAVSASGEVCVINVGSPNEVIPGLRYIVSRRGEDIAELTIDWVLRGHSAARVTAAASPVRAGDRVRGPWGRTWVCNLGGILVETSDGRRPEPTPPDGRVKGLVAAADGSEILLAVGYDDTVKPGDEFTISRDGRFVAMVTVELVRRDTSLAVVWPGTSNMPAQAGDLAWMEWKEVRHDEPINVAK